MNLGGVGEGAQGSGMEDWMGGRVHDRGLVPALHVRV